MSSIRCHAAFEWKTENWRQGTHLASARRQKEGNGTFGIIKRSHPSPGEIFLFSPELTEV